MGFPDITEEDIEKPRKNASTFRRKINTIVGHSVNEKAMQNIEEGDTVEVKLDGNYKKGIVKRTNPTSATIYVPETKETWRVSGFYLRRVRPKDEII